MKSITLSDLRKKKDIYFKKKEIKAGEFSNKKIQYIVERAYDAIPSNLKKYLENRTVATNIISNIIRYASMGEKINAYKLIKENAEKRRVKSGDSLKAYIYRRFRQEEQSVYAKYNSYMYRQGFSALQYYNENVVIKKEASYVTAEIELPGTRKVKYDKLYIEIDFSGDSITSELY